MLVFIAYQSSVLARVVDIKEDKNVWDVLATGDTCQDCTQMLDLLLDMFSNTDFQDKIKRSLEELCDLLPGPGAVKLCKNQLEKNLPLAISFLTSTIKPDQVCKTLGLCGSLLDVSQKNLLMGHIQEGLMAAMTVSEVQSNPKCTFCIYLIKMLESMLPKERTEVAVVELLGSVCNILPAHLKAECKGFIETYGRKLLELLLGYATPQAICSVLHLCKGQETPIILAPPSLTESGVVSDCDSCLILAVLTRINLGSNATEMQTSSYLSSVCQLHPKAFPKCDSFTKYHGNQLKRVLGKNDAPLELCMRVGLCGGAGGLREHGGDPCTLGSSYRCRDLNTALECGAVSFCKNNVWE